MLINDIESDENSRRIHYSQFTVKLQKNRPTSGRPILT